MAQTLLAFLAMMIAMSISINQNRIRLSSYDSMVRSEYEIMANAVTIEQMEIVKAGTAWDDLEDWHGDTTNVSITIGSFAESFNLSYTVQYVDDNGNPSGAPTSVKEVEIIALNDRFNQPLFTHARLISE